MATLLPHNEGTVDRVLRGVLGLGLLYMASQGHVWGWIRAVPLLTAVVGSCPLYTVFGISTCPMQTSRTSKG